VSFAAFFWHKKDAANTTQHHIVQQYQYVIHNGMKFAVS